MMTSDGDAIVPEIGMGATKIMHSDRHAYTVIAVSLNGKIVVVQQDIAIRTDENGMSDCQSYRFERSPNGPISILSRRPNGSWRVVGDTQLFAIGYRDEHYDYGY